MAKGSWRFWIDRGGTFTDVVARSPQGELLVEKVLSVQPDQLGDPAVRAIRRLLGLDAADAHLPEGWIEEVRLGTTVATNAFLEQNGAPALLLVNQGFADLLRIGDQHRPDLFALEIERPHPLTVRVLEVVGRENGRTLVDEQTLVVEQTRVEEPQTTLGVVGGRREQVVDVEQGHVVGHRGREHVGWV